MTTHTYKSCPHCKRIYQSYTPYNKHFVVGEGSPLIKCPLCQRLIFDKDIKEPGFRKKPAFITPLNIACTGLVPWGILGAIIMMFDIISPTIFYTVASIVLLAIYVGSMILCIVFRKSIDKDTLTAYEESRKRLMNKEYVITLINCGYRVPERFLTEFYPDLVEFARSKKYISITFPSQKGTRP